MLIIQAIIVSIIGGIIFSIIGIIPGTDETATMAPITLILVLMGFEPVVIFAMVYRNFGCDADHTYDTDSDGGSSGFHHGSTHGRKTVTSVKNLVFRIFHAKKCPPDP
mgnify:CR=1 FL=1